MGKSETFNTGLESDPGLHLTYNSRPASCAMDGQSLSNKRKINYRMIIMELLFKYWRGQNVTTHKSETLSPGVLAKTL